jgi:predicted Zn-dependent peptidase
MIRRTLGLVVLAALAGCDPTTDVAPAPTVAPTTAPTTSSSAPSDPLGEKPTLAPPKAFTPPAPEVFKTPNGITVWLLERHTLPMVSISVAVPSGSAQDPADLPGLAHITADMLDEGAGERSAVELSSAVNDLGATLSVGNTVDGSFASLTVLKKNYGPAFAILADVVARPRFDPKEWKRVSELWQNDLRKRGDDAAAVSRVVTSAVLYGPDSPYGHPSDGLQRGAQKVTLDTAKEFYGAHWRPERAVLVVAGDVTKAEITQAVTASLDSWKGVDDPAAKAPAAPPANVTIAPPPGGPKQRLVLVDRPGAPQSVIAVVRDGVSASDPKLARLELINTALGGSFTSRLNQNLREDKAWSYGARSGFTESRGQGAFVARAAVLTDKTGPALKETLKELQDMAKSGLKPEELLKVHAQDRADLVQTYETVNGVTGRLAMLAMLGLPPSFDVTASRVRQTATLQELAPLAQAHCDPAGAILVIVGPRAEVAPQLVELGLTPEMWDTEGMPLATIAPAGKK